MIFDPIYLLVIGVGFALALGAQMWVKSAVSRWSDVALGRGMTGADIAASILAVEGIRDVGIEVVGGVLSDHYDPGTKTLRLSPANFHGRSIAAAGIAAHEVGHAIQHRDGYAPMKLRQALVPVAGIGTNLGLWLAVIGMVVGVSGLAALGVALFGAFVLFTLVTLPVEIDASRRAKRALLAGGFVSREEGRGVSAVLDAAAATYLAAAVSAVLQLAYWVFRVGQSDE